VSPDDYETLLAESHVDETAFSNGAERDDFIAFNCDKCVHDLPARRGNWGRGCPLLRVAISDDRRPKQFADGPSDPPPGMAMAQKWSCTEFTHVGGGRRG